MSGLWAAAPTAEVVAAALVTLLLRLRLADVQPNTGETALRVAGD